MNMELIFNLITVLLVFLLAFSLEYVVLPKVLLISKKKHLYDIPDARKEHKVATPRLGGVSFIPILLFSFLLVFSLRLWLLSLNGLAVSLRQDWLGGISCAWEFMDKFLIELCMLVCGMILLMLVGVKDDLIGVKFSNKFRVQIAAALCFCFGGVLFEEVYGILGVHQLPLLFSVPFSVFVIVLVTNSMNLIDGIDGLASGLSMVAAAAMGISFFVRDMIPQSMLSFACLGILIPFFIYNVFKPQARKLFMGDTGSLALGFLLGYLAIRHSQMNPGEDMEMMPILIPFSVLFVPAFDVARVMYTRRVHGKSLFKPDRSHIHHKLIDAGFNRRTTMIFILFISICVLLLNMLLSLFLNINIIIIFDFLLGILFNKWLSVYTRKRQN